MRKADFRERVEMPPTVLIAIFGMIVVAAVSLVVIARETTSSPRSVGGMIAMIVVLSIVSSFFPGLAAWGLRQGWKASPILVTVVGLWTGQYIIFLGDVLSVTWGVAGIAATVAVWLPSARRYRVARRAARAAS